jgi:phage baseplate assembly protein W
MPTERISRGFKDISLSFKYNPLTKDLIAIKNESAIARSVRNLVLTLNGESPFNYQKGSQFQKSIFENLDQISAEILQGEIRKLIDKYEPRVSVTNVRVIAKPDFFQFDVQVEYNIVGLPLPIQLLSFALTPTR